MIGDDEFSMRPSIDEWATVVKLFSKDSEINKDKLIVLRDVMAEAIHRIDIDVSIDTIKETVEANLFTCLNALMNVMNKQDSFTEDLKKKIANAKSN
jgi:hypothetical protein